MIGLLAQLFWTFLLIGAFTFGGGYAMLSLIQAQVVTAHAWLTESTFTDIVAISQMTPGPVGINCATYVGYDVMTAAGAGPLMGVVGSITATTAIMLPSFIIVMILVGCYSQLKKNPLFGGMMKALRPATVGLIGAAAIILCINVSWNGSAPAINLVRDNFPDWKSWVLFGAAFLASYKLKIHPILVIIVAGFLGFVIY